MAAKYSIYPTLLDAYEWMIGADSEDELMVRRKELIDKINRVPQSVTEATQRGTALNRLLDFYGVTYGSDIRYDFDNSGAEYAVINVDGKEFAFYCSLLDQLNDVTATSISQVFLSASIDTMFGDVVLYGYADYCNIDTIIDLKTTENYTPNKYREHWQHRVYPYCYVRGGLGESCVDFNYLTVELQDKSGIYDGRVFRECYVVDIPQCEVELRQFLESKFIPFLESVRGQITDNKIFKQI